MHTSTRAKHDTAKSVHRARRFWEEGEKKAATPFEANRRKQMFALSCECI